MITSTKAYSGKFVTNIVFCNSKREIICFKQLSCPIKVDKLNLESYFSSPFRRALVQFTDGSAYSYTHKKKQSAHAKSA